VPPSPRRFVSLRLRPQNKPCRFCEADAGEIATCAGGAATNRSDHGAQQVHSHLSGESFYGCIQ
jgi:hypothetical protein